MYFYVKSYFELIDKKSLLLILFILFVTIGFLDLLGVFLLGKFVGLFVAFDPNDIFLNHILNFSRVITNNQSLEIYTALPALVCIFFISKSLIAFLIQKELLKFSYQILVDIRKKLLSIFFNSSYFSIISKGQAELTNKVVYYADTFIRGIHIPMMRLVADVIMLIFLTSFLLYINPYVYLFSVFIIFIFFMIYWKIIKKKIYFAGQSAAIFNKKIISDTKNSFNGIKEAIILDKKDYYIDEYIQTSENLSLALRTTEQYLIMPKYAIEGIIVSTMAILILLSHLIFNDIFLNPEFLTILAYYTATALRVMPTLNSTLTSIGNMNNARFVIDELHKDLVSSRISQKNSLNNISDIKFTNNFKVSNIQFVYPDTKPLILDKINFTINKGDFVALTGKSGEGKSTLIDIILGLLPPSNGEIQVDGKNLDENNIFAWHKMIAFISQDTAIFEKSIVENITLEKNYKIDEKIIKTIELAGLSDDIKKFDKGYNTILSDEGKSISGGQKQRIAIARAIYQNKDILVLDEATSALDEETELKIIETLNTFKGQKTVFIITHRKPILNICNVHFDLRNGNLIKIK